MVRTALMPRTVDRAQDGRGGEGGGYQVSCAHTIRPSVPWFNPEKQFPITPPAVDHKRAQDRARINESIYDVALTNYHDRIVFLTMS